MYNRDCRNESHHPMVRLNPAAFKGKYIISLMEIPQFPTVGCGIWEKQRGLLLANILV